VLQVLLGPDPWLQRGLDPLVLWGQDPLVQQVLKWRDLKMRQVLL
jgi:hypothetical protein